MEWENEVEGQALRPESGSAEVKEEEKKRE
jgi:hypothetical protein